MTYQENRSGKLLVTMLFTSLAWTGCTKGSTTEPSGDAGSGSNTVTQPAAPTGTAPRATPAPSAAPSSQRFDAHPCEVSAAFPAPPIYQLVPSTSGGEALHLWTTKVGEVEYSLVCNCTKVSPEDGRKLFVAEALTGMYDKGVEASVKQVAGKLVSRKDIKVAHLRGVEFVIEPTIAAGTLFSRMLQVDNCTVGITIHAPAGGRPQGADGVLESLRLDERPGAASSSGGGGTSSPH